VDKKKELPLYILLKVCARIQFFLYFNYRYFLFVL